MIGVDKLPNPSQRLIREPIAPEQYAGLGIVDLVGCVDGVGVPRRGDGEQRGEGAPSQRTL
jgi:hypothetical protein